MDGRPFQTVNLIDQLPIFGIAFVADWESMGTMIKVKRQWTKPTLKAVLISMESTSYAGAV